MRRMPISPHARYMGDRIREARIAARKSQGEIAELIGVSYQQLQKYENGTSHVPSGRVELLVTALNRPLSYFFDATDVRGTADPVVSKFIASREGYILAQKFFLMTPGARGLVLGLVHHLAREQDR